MNVNFKWTSREDFSIPNNNYNDEIQTIELGDGYTFSDWLSDHSVDFKQDNNTYYVLVDGKRTGEAYFTVSEVSHGFC